MMPRKTINAKISNRLGLHARPATMFAQTCAAFNSEVEIEYGDDRANGRNVLEIMSLAIQSGADFLIRADGDDAEQTLTALTDLIVNRFGEPE